MKRSASSPGAKQAGPGGDGPQSQAQKRAAVRLRLASLPAEVWALEETVSRRLTCRVLNVSEGGALVEAEEAEAAVAEGQSAFCRVALPKGPLIHGRALIVRREQAPSGTVRLGLQFEGMSLPERDVLVRWIFAELAHRRR